ncbi:MAG TPA: M1 family aminopeptidase [Bacteroidales bacterium]|nr:M1 family aminopeptidase [Bacteroidales bacterium]HPS62546.1 M1 family aminopeptidase [Bacteroidales bacterium]
MKTILLSACILLSLVLRAQTGDFRPADQPVADQEKKANSGLFSRHASEEARNYDVSWYRCHWVVDPAVRAISGSVTTLFTVPGGAADSVVFDMAAALVADSVLFHRLPVTWSHSGDRLRINLSPAVPSQGRDSVTVFYHGIPPDQGFGSFVQSVHNGVPILWTLSEPYGSSDWWPCRNGLSDKADSIDIFLEFPAGNRSAGNGILVSETQSGGTVVHHWKHRYPIAPYLVCMAVTNYAKYSHFVPFQGDTLRVDNYIYPEDSTSAASQTGIIVPMIQVYDTLFGTYPFQAEKYGHAQFGWGGGMEHQTMTFVTSFGFELLAHELAHMWFGDKVTCGSWTDIWLNEGFATYLSGLCYEHLIPELWKRFREVRVKSVTSSPGGSVYCPDTTSVNRIFDGRLSYAKGALILHQLRWLMGDGPFFTALNHYLADPQAAYGFARTSQLKAHLESACGCDLTEYFNDWYTGEGYPSYQVGWQQQGDTVAITVNQTQSHPSVSFFEMDIPLKFKNETRDTILRFHHTFSGQTFRAILPFAVDSVLFDPDYQLISANNAVSQVEEMVPSKYVAVFPNPARQQVTFRFSPSLAREYFTIVLFDMTGKRVLEVPHHRDETSRDLPVNDLPAGLYSYLLESNGIRINGKITLAPSTE